jgi:hypothetical protein
MDGLHVLRVALDMPAAERMVLAVSVRLGCAGLVEVVATNLPGHGDRMSDYLSKLHKWLNPSHPMPAPRWIVTPASVAPADDARPLDADPFPLPRPTNQWSLVCLSSSHLHSHLSQESLFRHPQSRHQIATTTYSDLNIAIHLCRAAPPPGCRLPRDRTDPSARTIDDPIEVQRPETRPLRPQRLRRTELRHHRIATLGRLPGEYPIQQTTPTRIATLDTASKSPERTTDP